MTPSSTERSRKRRSQMSSNERTQYQAHYAHKRRTDLVRLLSPEGLCALCGQEFSHEELTVDHVDGIGWDHESLNQHRRVARYWKEYKEGIPLRAACGSCNSSDGSRFRGKGRG